MKAKYYLFVLACILTINISAQKVEWRTAPLFDNSNFYEIVTQQEKVFEAKQNVLTREDKRERKQFKRWKNFWQDRVMPDGSFVSEYYTYSELLKEKKKPSVQNKAVAWSLIGPVAPPVSPIDAYAGMGRVNTITFQGTNTNILYIGTPAGGIWKSINGGNTWTPIGDDLPNIGVSDIVIDPSNPNTLYAASGDFDGLHTRSLGVFKSINGGTSWNSTGLTFTLNQNDIIGGLLIHPTQTNTIFATTKNNIKKSIDAGVTWTNVHTDNGKVFNDILVAYGSDSVLIATNKAGDFYYSEDLGNNWSLDSSPSSNRIDITLSPDAPRTIFLLDENGSFKKSFDGGLSWVNISTIPTFSSQGGYNQVIAVSPIDSNLILVGGVHGWRSTNGGASWQKYLDGYWNQGDPFFYVHSDHHEMVFVPGTNTAFSGNDGGVHFGDASSNTAWVDKSSGLAITQFYSISGTPQNSNFLLMGAQDNDVARYNGNGWSGLNPSSDGVETLWDYSNSNVAWTCSQIGGLDRTTDGFQTSTVLNTPNGAPFVWELEINPLNPLTIYGGFLDIFKSTDRGDNWTNLSSGAGQVESIGISASDTNTIYVSGAVDFVKTSNGGTSWSSLSIPNNDKISSIAVHPTNPQIVYITYTGYTGGRVYKSTNGGTSWVDISGALPNVPAHKVLYKTGTISEELFVATDLGVYYKTSGSNGWQKLGTGLPNVIVMDMEIDYSSDMLRVATYGRGVWETSIDPIALGVEKEGLLASSINLYPNPTINKEFKIELNNLAGNSEIIVFNMVGSIVKEYNTNASLVNVKLSNHATGLYMVKVINDGKSSISKIIVE